MVDLSADTYHEQDKLQYLFSVVVHRRLHNRGLCDGVVLCTAAAEPRPTVGDFYNDAKESRNPSAGGGDVRGSGDIN